MSNFAHHTSITSSKFVYFLEILVIHFTSEQKLLVEELIHPSPLGCGKLSVFYSFFKLSYERTEIIKL